MRIKCFITLLTIILITQNYVFSQTLNNNLRNLDKMSIQIVDEEALLSDKISQKLTTEIKLKLMSAGIKVLSADEASARMAVTINAIKSKFAAHRILVIMNIEEEVITQRKNSVKTNAITYYDYAFFASEKIEQAVYDKIMDTMIIKFIEKYLGENKT